LFTHNLFPVVYSEFISKVGYSW